MTEPTKADAGRALEGRTNCGADTGVAPPAPGSAAYLAVDHARNFREAAETIAWMSDTLRMAYLHVLEESAYSQADRPPRLSPAEERELGRRLAEHWHTTEYWRSARQPNIRSQPHAEENA